MHIWQIYFGYSLVAEEEVGVDNLFGEFEALLCSWPSDILREFSNFKVCEFCRRPEISYWKVMSRLTFIEVGIIGFRDLTASFEPLFELLGIESVFLIDVNFLTWSVPDG